MIKKKFSFPLIIIFIVFIFIAATGNHIYSAGRNLYVKIKLFSEILNTINDSYVEEVSYDTLIENAIQGMVTELDPHTKYMTTEQFNEWNKNYRGYFGIGIRYDIINKKITVISVFEGSPSDKAGIKPGDRIVTINGESAYGIKREKVPEKLMGPKGTKVNVGIERSSWKTPHEVVIIRDEIHVKSIPYIFMIDENIGYMHMVRFSKTTENELIEGLQYLESKGMKKLVLDLRNNGGGYLLAAVEVVDRFLEKDRKIVYTRGRIKNSIHQFFSTDNNTYSQLPIIILINRHSASASEIVSGSLQDWDRAIILGETSFGKGLVQNQYTFNDGSALLITTARYYTPSGRLIQRPFKNKSHEEYYKEVLIDSLRKIWEQEPTRPQYQTMILKRNILGGGGITPDIFLKTPEDTISDIVRDLYYSKDRLFFTFAESIIDSSEPELSMTSEEYLNHFDSCDLFSKFLNYIKDKEIECSFKEIKENKKDIIFLLKRAVANQKLGNGVGYKLTLLHDIQFKESIKYFPEAEQLIEQRTNNN
ncbi:MAG: S41 family peptidase [bacterium]